MVTKHNRHEVVYECDHCGRTFTASAHDPLFVEVVEQHQLWHDERAGFTPRWSSPGDWSPAFSYRPGVPVSWLVAVGGAVIISLLVLVGVGVGAIS